MPSHVKIATIGPKAIALPVDTDPDQIVDRMIDFWRTQFEQVLPDRPDLIVVPEACDRPDGFPVGTLLTYYRRRGNRIRDFFASVAREHCCHIVYSASRELPDGTWRNSSLLIGRKGEVIGIYNKNHVVVEETTNMGVLCGKDAPIFACDFGTVACAICFDLNFAQLRERYAPHRPRLILFSSMYHGGLMQQYWAYACRSYFVGAIAGPPSEIRNPYGEVIASTTNYRNYAVADVNLDYRLAHLDYNREKLTALKAKYGRKVDVYDPGLVGSVLITNDIEGRTADDLAAELGIELLDDYFPRALGHHRAHTEE